jgi:hypothetical protein
LAYWLWRSGALAAVPLTAFEPYACRIAGDWRGAAAVWEALGCPYERALAVAGGNARAQQVALSLVDHLGAAPAAERLRKSIRAG